MTAEFQVIDLEIPPELAGQRLDSALARLLPEHSRTRIKGWIEAGAVKVDRVACKPRDLVEAGSRVRVQISIDEPAQPQVLPEAIALRLVHEDRDVLVIDKPAGLVVHPGAGNPSLTLQNALLGFDPALGKLPRAGLIHRLDKDTSGVMVFGKTAVANRSLTEQFTCHSIRKIYRLVTDRQYRALMLRHHGHCAHPGCPNTKNLHAHHRIHWIHGGRTDLDNLLLLCERHHLAHHDGQFHIHTAGAGRFRFVSSDGHDLRAPLRNPASPDSRPLEEEHAAVAADAATPRWDGQRLDRPYAISALAQRRQAAG